MVKSIKKSFKIFIIFTGVLILLPGILYPVLQLPAVQTFLINRITGHISKNTKSTISIGRIEFRFFNRLAINDILIKDQHNDTLLYTKEIIAGIRRFDAEKKIIRLGRVTVVEPVVALITDSAGMMNLKWYLEMLKNPQDTVKKMPLTFSADQIDLSDARFFHINHSAEKVKNRIDFNNLGLASVNAIVEDLRIFNDSTTFTVYNLGFIESSGFGISRMSASVLLTKGNILLNSAFIATDSSMINIRHLAVRPDSSGSLSKFLTNVRLDLQLDKSLINSSDIHYFITSASPIIESVWLSGRFFGTVAELRGRNISLSYRGSTYLDCDFDFSGLPNIDNTFMFIGVNSLRTTAADISKFRIGGREAITIPGALKKIGTISFDGSFTGFTTDFVTYGEIRTDQGNIRTDISLRPDKSGKYRIRGLLTGSGINIGNLVENNEQFGKLSFSTSVDGYAYSFKKFAANLTGRIDSIQFRKYLYRNITLKGLFTEKTWDGSINISEKNIKLDLLGLFDFSKTLPEFDFTLNLARANLYNLNFDKSDSTSSVSMILTSNFRGNKIDNLDGEIKMLNSNLTKYGSNLELYDFSFRTFRDKNTPVLSLHTDFMDAEIRGDYNFEAAGRLVSSALAALKPGSDKHPWYRNEGKKNNFTFEVNFRNTDNINNFFRTAFLLAEKSYLRGSVMNDTVMKIEAKAKSFSIKNNTFSDLNISADLSGRQISAGLASSSLSLLRESELKDFSMDFRTRPGNFVFTVDWDNNERILNKGRFIARGRVTPNPSGRGKDVLLVNIDSSDIFARNNRWKISNSSLVFDSSAVTINRFFVNNNDNYYLINGSVSENPSDTLNLEFSGIDISPLNYFGNKSKIDEPDRLFYDFRGQLNGKILLSDVYRNLLLEANISIDDFGILGSSLGNLSVSSELDLARKILNIKAANNLEGSKMIDIRGYYDPTLRRLNLGAQADKLPIVFLNPLLRSFASGITGLASGKVNLSIAQGIITLTGALLADNAAMKVNYLQTRYRMSDSIRFDRKGIKFNSIKVYDDKGNTATVSGRVNHKNFKDFSADLLINSNECLVLNTKPKDNELFYGTAYASGVTTIKSGPNSLAFDISARTGKNTKFYIPLNTGLSVSEYSFISFVDQKTGSETGNSESVIKIPPPQTGIELNFDLEITPDAEAQLIFDSKVGDVMKGHGSGNLNLQMTPKGDFRINGDYIIDDGDYLFTLGNILNKSFSVENGGKIMFNGDIDDAEIDIKAIYKLKASLYDILQDENFKERIPVECQLNLTGNLFNPIVGFNIYLPTADERTRTYLRNAISTDEELSRQFLYLLVMNSFYPDPQWANTASSSSSSTPSGTSAMAVTTTEMLSNQLSNWLSQISNDFDIGFVYRPGTGNKDINTQEVQVALSTQLLNDKVKINGNFDVRGTGSGTDNTNQITGDFDAEVKLTDKLNLKVFNRYNNPYTGKGVDYTQGIGIFFRRDFDRFSDLFRKTEKSEMKKEEEPVPEN